MTESHLPKDHWARGDAYEPYVGRWSRIVAHEFIHWLDLPKGHAWLDVGCGTGALTQTILQMAEPSKVKGLDRSEGFIEYASARVQDPRVDFETADAQSLPVDDKSYDAAVSGLVLNFVPKPEVMISEMTRASRRLVAVYVWDYGEGMQMMRHFWNAAAALEPEAAKLDEGPRFVVCQPEPLKALFESQGLKDVQVRPIDVPTVFKDFDDYWLPFLGGQGPAPTYAMSLSEEHRAALRDKIRTNLTVAKDGSIPLSARAWAVKGNLLINQR
jgi:SAM-dependent methyltransferase